MEDHLHPRWLFDQPENCASFSTRPVMAGTEPILLVCHEAEDHGWQFIGLSGASMEIAMLVSLKEIVDLDPSVIEAADLEPGWEASREFVGGPWSRRKAEDLGELPGA